MRKQRKIRKEDIGDPSNFVHVEGYGMKKLSMAGLHAQRSLDLDVEGSDEREIKSECNTPAVGGEPLQFPMVERRSRGSRSSLIPRHHRSTTTCIFPENGLQNHVSIPSSREERQSSPDRNGNGTPLKPFGSLLNLSFLPLGLGKSSGKSSSTGKNKRMSLLNLTATNLFAGNKAQEEEDKGAVMMTGYTRRRSFSNNRGDGDNSNVGDKGGLGTLRKKDKPKVAPLPPSTSKENDTKTPPPTPSRIPLAKLGRSKSTMSEITKRPKLRLKIIPPVVPPPTPPSKNTEESLPSPPPSPIPSPPKTPTSAPPVPPPPPTEEEEAEALANNIQVVLRRIPKSPPRSRIIPLPSCGSANSLDSPQYLTPLGGSSPQLQPRPSSESAFPMLMSPTLPPSSTPFFPPSQKSPGTPPVWPLQPSWPASVTMQQTEPTIHELPSPIKEIMDIAESEYDPVASIVDSFVSTSKENKTLENVESDHPNNLEIIKFALLSSTTPSEMPSVLQTLLKSTQSLSSLERNNTPERISRIKQIQKEMLTKALELWMEMTDESPTADQLASVFDEENQQAADSLRKVCLSENNV